MWEGDIRAAVLVAGAFAVAYLVSIGVAPLSAGLARRIGITDKPDGDGEGYKRHAAETPYLGGVAIAAGIAAGGSLLLLVAGGARIDLIRLFLIGGAVALALGVMGLLDDIRSLHPLLRLGVQVAAALGAWVAGFRVEVVPWDALNLAITLIWIVGITNAFNLLDNMDGLSAGIAGVAGASFAVMGLLSANPALAIASAAIAGATFGFLQLNRHPAEIFMGDSGSLLLGYLLALIGMRLEFDNLLEVTFLVPVVVLGVPIFDTTLVVLSRLRHGRGPFTAGRDHASHRLVALGLPVKEAVGLLYWSGACLGWLGIVITRSNVQVGWMLLGFVLALGLFFGRLLWKVPVYEVQPDGVAVEAITSGAPSSTRVTVDVPRR